MSRVSGGFLSAQVVQRRFQRWHDEGEVLEWPSGTMSPSMAKQVRIPGESSGGSGEAPCTLRLCRGVVCGGGCGEAPTRLRPGSMSQSDLGEELSRSFRIRRKFLVFGVHGAAAVLRRGVLHGGGSFGVVRWASLLTSANVRP